MTIDEVKKRLDAGESEDVLAAELLDIGYERLIEAMNELVDENAVYRHPRVAVVMAVMLAGTVISECLDPEDWDKAREVFATALGKDLEEAKARKAEKTPEGES